MEGSNKSISLLDWLGDGCSDVAEDRDRWRALVTTAMNLRVLAPRSQLFRRVLASEGYAKGHVQPEVLCLNRT
jgi:hypothetical protein